MDLTVQHRVYGLEGDVNLFTDLRARQDNLATDKDQENYLWLNHSVDQSREQLRLVGAKVVMAGGKTLKTNGEFDVARSNDVLNLEIGELGIKTKLLDDTSVLAGRKLGIIFRLRTSDNHLARGEDQRRGLRFADTHNHSSKTLK